MPPGQLLPARRISTVILKEEEGSVASKGHANQINMHPYVVEACSKKMKIFTRVRSRPPSANAARNLSTAPFLPV